MKKTRFSEEQIVRILKEVEAGAKVNETCCKHGVAEATYYNWKSRFAGMGVSQLRRLKELEAENAKLNRPGFRRHLQAIIYGIRGGVYERCPIYG